MTNQAFMDQLQQWHEEDAFDRIINAIEAIDETARGYELTGLLARAYQNESRGDRPELYEKSIRLLEDTRVEGENDPNWHFRMGFALYWLDREPQAAPYFRRVLELIPDDPQTQAFWSDCRELLEYCEAEEKEKAGEAAEELPFDPDDALRFLLQEELHQHFETTDVLEENRVYLPAWQLTVTPTIAHLTSEQAVLHFWISKPGWDKSIFECSVGMGGSARKAIGMATASFHFALMQGIGLMERREQSAALESTFAGNTHKWEVYLSNILGIGKTDGPDDEGMDVYWNALREEIAKRLGNQRMCYVKIYGAKVNGEVTGECRIDDVKSEALSARVAEIVSRWEVKDFASQKQFFFLLQKEETTLPNRYAGEVGRQLLKKHLIHTARLFFACENEQQYDSLEARAAQEIKDPVLAAQLCAFLPEMCAENAFDQLSYPETLEIKVGDAPAVTCYKNQLADYWPIWETLFSAFEEGVFGDDTNGIYQRYIGVSSIYNVVRQMEEDKKDLTDCRLSSLLFRMDEDFVIR